MKIGIIVTLVVLVIVGITFGVIGVGWSNTEIELRNLAEAQQESNKVIYDKVWKVIKQKAQITDKYAKDFKSVYNGMMEKRYSADKGNNPTFKWIKEHNPDFSVEMYKDIADAVEGLRAEFAMVQKRLLDIKKEHDNLRQRFPSSLIVGSRKALDIKIVTSTKTEETFASGKEENVDVF